MIPTRIGLVSLSKKPTHAELTKTAAALQKQLTRDLGPIWNIEATIDFFPNIKSIPFGYWPIIIVDSLKHDDESGYHKDKNHLPYAVVKFGNGWQQTCSHEMCEMLVNPFLNKLATAPSPKAGQGKVQYVIEICDPCTDLSFAYHIDGISMSDFCTPNFFDNKKAKGVRYSFTGAITAPRHILKKGTIYWHDPKTGKWFEQSFNGSKKVIKNIVQRKSENLSLQSLFEHLAKRA
jgi:hypothetical protein